MKIEVPYNREKIALEVAPEHFGAILKLNDQNGGKPKKSAVEITKEAIKGSFDEFLALPGSTLVIVNDGTRPTPTRLVMDAIGPDLERCKASFLVATGSHRAPYESEYDFIFGSWYGTFRDRIHVHDCHAMDDMDYYGRTSRGTELYLNKLVKKASKVIVIGSVEPHYFAGYTGGRKGFLPGVAAFSSIEHNHKMALSADAKALALEGNPVHEDLMEAMSLVSAPVYAIMTVLDRNHEIDTVTAGDITKSFDEAVEAANRIFTAPLKEKADIVVTAAPYPMDVDLYQSQKAIDNAKLALKDGGTMILVSACREGIGGESFVRLLSSASTPDEVLSKIAEGFKLGYHKAAKMAEIFRWAHVQAYSQVSDDQMRKIFIEPVHDLQKALDDAIAKYGEDCKVVFMPDGSVTVPKIG
ncbi:MAG: nickel-dependent lactate racemase [Spirochaetales bacterium]|nr:nickel-dependent lactate racemase [Spirochaetales bacterium]